MAARRASIQDCRNYYAGEEAEELDVAIVQGTAARTVQQLAPEPAETDEDYEEAAREAELLLGRWIWRSDGGALSSKSLSGVTSKSYAKFDDVRNLVSSAMGSFYKGAPSGAGNVAYVSSYPLSRG